MIERSRVLVIGLDGVCWDLLEPLMAAGVMPFLARIRREGASGELLSTIPPVSATAWASFMTGVNPGGHGVFEFTYRRPESLAYVPVNAACLQAPTLWARLSAAGIRVGVYNVPVTYPPAAVNGFLIAGMMTPRGAQDFAYPRSLLDELETRFGSYRLHHRRVYTPGRAGRVLSEAEAILDYRLHTALYLLRRWDPDFSIVYFHGTDRVQHELWHILDETHPSHDPREAVQCRDRVLAYFRSVDRAVESLSDLASPQDTVIVMSDHGFGPIHRYVNLNVWLLQQGFLSLRGDVTTRLKRLAFRCGLTPALSYRAAMRLGLAHLRLAAGMTGRASLLRLVEKWFFSFHNVDWSRTVAYSWGNYGQIYVNLRGREPQGSVSPADYGAVRQQIAERLLQLTDAETGRPLIEQVLAAEQVFQGDHLNAAPDLVPIMRDMRYKALGTVSFTSNHLIERAFGNSGDHRMEGVVTLRGPAVKAGYHLSRNRIVDLAPTILFLLGQPVPPGLDGTIMLDAFEPAYLATHPVTDCCRTETPEEMPACPPYEPAEEGVVLEQLRRLGYVA